MASPSGSNKCVCAETSSSLHRCRNPLPKLSLLTQLVVWIKNAQISVSFTSTATASGCNMCALKHHHHCTVAENLSRNSHCLHNAQISVSFTSTATDSGSNVRALKRHYPCTVAENIHRNFICSHNCGQDQEYSDIGFVHVNGDRLWIQHVCVETSWSLHLCRAPSSKLSLLTQM